MHSARKLSTNDLTAFRATLEKAGYDRANETDMDLADIYFDDEEFRMGQVPTTVPSGVRDIIRDLVAQKRALQTQLDGIVGSLQRVSDSVVTRLHAAREAAKPHCKCCGQVVEKKRR